MDRPDAEPAFEDVELVRDRVRQGLSGVERVVAVMSGKGGVGKSAVAVNLALALAARGQRVGVFDADLHGPSVAAMLGLRGQPVRVTADGLRPQEGPSDLRVQSMDFFLQGAQPLDWDGPMGEGARLRSAMEESAIADLLGSTTWGDLETLVVDLAPGADRLPALAQLVPSLSGALAVTIPTEVALLAVERSIRRAHDARIPVLGLVENLGSAVCGECGAEGPLFREADVQRLTEDLDVEVVARIPFDPQLAEAADAGRPFVGDGQEETPARRAFRDLASRIAVVAALLLALTGAGPAAAAEETWRFDAYNDLMSPYCPGRSLNDCPSPQAKELRDWIGAQEDAGRPRADVEDQLYRLYGDQIRSAPEARGWGIAVYAIPAGALVIGGLIVVVVLRHRSSEPPPAPDSAPVDPELEARIDRELGIGG